MLFELKMPKLNDNMDTGLIETAYGAEGSALKLGSKLLDISVDLSRAFSQNCPPVSYYRLVLRETAMAAQPGRAGDALHRRRTHRPLQQHA